MIGFDDKALERANLARAIGQDPVAFITGDIVLMAAREIPSTAPPLPKPLPYAADVSAFAVAAHLPVIQLMKLRREIFCAIQPGCL